MDRWSKPLHCMLSGLPRVSLLIVVLVACSPTKPSAQLALESPPIRDTANYGVAARIFENETGGKTEFLSHWGEGEDFPSLGIGHFIWFPRGVVAPFDETFPTLVNWLRENGDGCAPEPDWLRTLEPFDAPWASKIEFDEQHGSEQLLELREWLVATAADQARFITWSFVSRWNEVDLPVAEKSQLTVVLQQLMESPAGRFAAIDYYNFKGLGTNPRERYDGQGWGMVQVLVDMIADEVVTEFGGSKQENLVRRFSDAAGNRLRLRVANAPEERDEGRWLSGWLKRVDAYNSMAAPLHNSRLDDFRVTPYVVSASAESTTLGWFSHSDARGQVTISGQRDSGDQRDWSYSSQPELSCELAYHLTEFADLDAGYPTPFKHRVQIDGLLPGETYRYRVEQGGDIAAGHIKGPLEADQPIRLVVYADSETEPESTGKRSRWPANPGTAEQREYVTDQTDGYAANLFVIGQSDPDFIAIAGDLVESGGEQRDWDEFWRHNASIARSVPIVPALGNHEYYGGPGDLGGYSDTASQRALAKYRAYFERPSWYVKNYGPIAFIVIDSNNGLPERSPMDTNWLLSGSESGGIAPAWQVGSEQMQWLQQALSKAQATKQFTFVMFHHAPYSSGVHGQSPGVEEGRNFASGQPLQTLSALFMRYGVDVVFNGHDEMYEHSAVTGQELRADGSRSPHSVHFLTAGIGGDGLRGPAAGSGNQNAVFMAHKDSPEIYDDNGILLDGGKHYGHAAVEVTRDESGDWQARIEPVYVFPIANTEGDVIEFERRVYDDVLVLESANEH